MTTDTDSFFTPYPWTDLPHGNDVAYRFRYASRADRPPTDDDTAVRRELGFRAALDAAMATARETLAADYPEFDIEIGALPPGPSSPRTGSTRRPAPLTPTSGTA